MIDALRIRIGNQTAISAGRAERPFAFAVEKGFDAFEWFPDRNEMGAGWTEDDLDREQRVSIRKTARDRDIRLSVHAPWWANPLNPEAMCVLDKSIDFAQDLGASLFNLHLYHGQEAASFVRAIEPMIERLASTRIRLSFENTPLTGPDECNALFEALTRSGRADPERVGMCFDLGHANLCQATRNDYLKFMDLLDPDISIIHLHLHENYGDRDAHLPLFTGPAGRDPSGIEGLLQRLAKRQFSGCIILEQWPDPPSLLCEARNRLLEMIGKVNNAHRDSSLESGDATLPSLDGRGRGRVTTSHQQHLHPVSPIKGEELVSAALANDRGTHSGSSGSEPADDFLQRLIASDRQKRSWREKLEWIRDVLNEPEIASDLEQLVYLAVYLRFIGTGQVPCHEDGRHFRPSHHAVTAREIAERLTTITTSQNIHVVRRIIPWLPSSESEFTRSEPLTLIRDIAHRNDIPKELKTEIKHTLQNKLHRCAGPEDLVTSAGILARITAPEAAYAPAFVAQFQHFHEQLREFFNARSLEEQLEAIAREANDPDARLIGTLLEAKASATDLSQQLRVLRLLRELRERFHERMEERNGSVRQQFQLADIRLEEYAFALLSQLNQCFDLRGNNAEELGHEVGKAGLAWPTLLECLLLIVGNLRCSGFDGDECRAVEAELEAWRKRFEPHDYEQVLRLKATLERARRLADDHRDTILRLFPQCAARLGQALGVAEPAIKVYAESEIRSHVVFQLAKMLALSLKVLRELAGLSPWEVIVPGCATGVFVVCTGLEQLPNSAEPTIVLIDRLQGDEEIPRNVIGVVVPHETPYLSHFAVRAREQGVVFVSCDVADPVSAIRSLAGRHVVLKASPEKVTVTPSSDEGLHPACPQQSEVTSRPLRSLGVELCQEACVLSLDRVTVANAGRKADGAKLLEELSGRDGATFKTPRSLVIPFGAMEASLHSQPSVEKEFHRCLGFLSHLPPEDLPENLGRLRSLIRGLELPDAVNSRVIEYFGADARLMVRSSASCEDLEEMAGAGLYESVANVAAEELTDAVLEVWASLWSRQATASRKNVGLPHDRAFMAVLIQQLVAPDLSFIMHTVNPATGNLDELLMELVVGLGQTLASADRPGSPYRLVGNKLTGEIRLLAFANFSKAAFPDAQAGAFAETVDYSQIAFSINASHRESLGRRLTAVGKFVEEGLGTPQDIEGVVVGETLNLVQSRPQQGVFLG